MLHCRDLAFGLFCPPVSVTYFWDYLPSSNSSPSWSACCSHSTPLSTPPSRPPISVVIRYFRSGCIAFSFASRLATHLFSARRCHPIPTALSSFLRTLLSLHHFLHLVYKWSTDCSACWHLRLLHVQPWAGRNVKRIFWVLVLIRGVFRVLGEERSSFGSSFPSFHFYPNAMSGFPSFSPLLSFAWHGLENSTVQPEFYYQQLLL